MIRKIDIIFWSIIIIRAIIEIIQTIQSGAINIHFVTDSHLELLSMKDSICISFSITFFMLFMFFFFVIASLLQNFYLTFIYIGARIAYKKYSKEKLDKIDLKNNSYYRDIISKYSPAVLSYIDDFKLEEKDIVATLMSLELKQKLTIKDGIKIINDSEENLDENEKYIFKKLKSNTLKNINMLEFEENLDENEKYIFKKLKSNTLKNINMLEFEEKVKKDCLDYNLLEENKDIKKKIIKKIIFSVCIYILIVVGFFNFPTFYNNIPNKNIAILFLPVMFILFFIMIILPFSTIVYIKSYYRMNKQNPYIRNKQARNINKKLEGLRNYMKDFSQLSESQYNEIVLWEDYLIYSVILGQNSKIVKEIMEKINE